MKLYKNIAIEQILKIREFFLEKSELESVRISPTFGISNDVDVLNSIYFERYYGRAIDIKLDENVIYDIFNSKIDFYFDEFSFEGNPIPILILTIGYFPVNPEILWGIRNSWLHDINDADELENMISYVNDNANISN